MRYNLDTNRVGYLYLGVNHVPHTWGTCLDVMKNKNRGQVSQKLQKK